jgi:hypothetical protein
MRGTRGIRREYTLGGHAGLLSCFGAWLMGRVAARSQAVGVLTGRDGEDVLGRRYVMTRG